MIRINLNEREKYLLEMSFLKFFSDNSFGSVGEVLEYSDNLDNVALKKEQTTIQLEKLQKKYKDLCKTKEYHDPDNKKLCPLQIDENNQELNINLMKKLLLEHPEIILDDKIADRKDEDLMHLRKYSDLLGLYYVLYCKETVVNGLEVTEKKWKKKSKDILEWVENKDVKEHPAMWRYIRKSLKLDDSKDIKIVQQKFKDLFDVKVANSFDEFKQFYKNYEELAENVKCFFNELCDYKKYISDTNRYLLYRFMKVSVCPYCNRQYITLVEGNDVEKGTATFDHYLREAPYPMFKITLYNLVPSCYACNSLLKGVNDKRHLNPWREAADPNMKFKLEGLDIENCTDSDQFLTNYYGTNFQEQEFDYKLILDQTSINEHSKGSESVFKLEELYKVHNGYALMNVARAYRYELSSLGNSIRDFLNDSKYVITEKNFDLMLYGMDFDDKGCDQAMYVPLYKLNSDLIGVVKEIAKTKKNED